MACGDFQPSLQVIEVHRLGNGRRLLAVSDGGHFVVAVLNQSAEMQLQGAPPLEFCIVQLVSWTVKRKEGYTSVFIEQLRYVTAMQAKIGNPQQLDRPNQGAAPPTTAATGQAPLQSAREPLAQQPGQQHPNFGANPYAQQPGQQQQQQQQTFGTNPNVQQQLGQHHQNWGANSNVQQPGRQQPHNGGNPYAQQAAPPGPANQAGGQGFGGQFANQSCGQGFGGQSSNQASGCSGQFGHQAVGQSRNSAFLLGADAIGDLSSTQPDASAASAAAVRAAARPQHQQWLQQQQQQQQPSQWQPQHRQQQLQQPVSMSANPSANSSGTITPIRELSQYGGSKFKIKARVVVKGDVRKFVNAKGEGQFFKVELVDGSGETSGTFFGNAVDIFYTKVQQGQVYTFSRGAVKAANPRFDKTPLCITFEEHSVIEHVPDNEGLPGLKFDCMPLCEIDSKEVNSLVDARAIIVAATEPYTFISKRSNKELTKQELGLWDNSGSGGSTCTELTFWGAQSAAFNVGSVILVKSARVSEWNGAKSLNSPATFELDRDEPEASSLKARFEEYKHRNGLPVARVRGSNGARKTIAECREEDMHLALPPPPGQAFEAGGPRSVHNHVVLGTVTFLPLDRMPCYPACPEQVESNRPSSAGQPAPTRQCAKKLSQEGPGLWACMSGHTCSEPHYRYICRAGIADATGSLEIQLYDSGAEPLFGCPANEIARLWELRETDEASAKRLQEITSRLTFRQSCLKLSAKKEVWQEEERVRYGVNEGSAVDFAKEGKRLLLDVNATAAAVKA